MSYYHHKVFNFSEHSPTLPEHQTVNDANLKEIETAFRIVES